MTPKSRYYWLHRAAILKTARWRTAEKNGLTWEQFQARERRRRKARVPAPDPRVPAPDPRVKAARQSAFWRTLSPLEKRPRRSGEVRSQRQEACWYAFRRALSGTWPDGLAAVGGLPGEPLLLSAVTGELFSVQTDGKLRRHAAWDNGRSIRRAWLGLAGSRDVLRVWLSGVIDDRTVVENIVRGRGVFPRGDALRCAGEIEEVGNLLGL